MTTGLEGQPTNPPAPQERPLPQLFSECPPPLGAAAERDSAGGVAADSDDEPGPLTPAAEGEEASDLDRSLASTLQELEGRLPRRRTRARAPTPLMRSSFTAEQRLLLLDTWQRSNLPAGDFAPLVGMSTHTLYAWKQRFEAEGPAGLCDRGRGRESGSRLPEATRRAIYAWSAVDRINKTKRN